VTTLLKKQEVDHHVLKLIVGVVAIGLATITAAFSSAPIDSISASYHQGGWARDFFVGCLFAVSAFMLAYNGYSVREMIFSKIAAVAALGVALFPCGCDGHPELIPYLHYISAGVMFAVLAVFCVLFRQRAIAKGTPQGRARALIYSMCGLTIVAVILVLAGDHLAGGVIRSRFARLVFHGEGIGLTAFGISWLLASRTIPFVTASNERISLLPNT